MTVQTSTTVRDKRLRALTQTIDAAGEGAKLRLYSGTVPTAGASVPVGATLLVELPIAYPCEDSLISGVLYLKPIEATIAVETGIATWGRIVDATEAFILDGDAGSSTSSAFFKIQNEGANIYEGGLVALLEMTIAEA